MLVYDHSAYDHETYSVVPEALIVDPKLRAIDISVLFRALYLARAAMTCKATDQEIANHPRHSLPSTRRSLKRLEEAGHIRRVQHAPDQREIVFCWREDTAYLEPLLKRLAEMDCEDDVQPEAS